MKNKQEIKKIALGRIKQLFKEASENPKMGNRYVQLARRIGMRNNVRIPREFKRRFCRHCYRYFSSGNYRVRTRNKMVVYYCLSCKRFTRFRI